MPNANRTKLSVKQRNWVKLFISRKLQIMKQMKYLEKTFKLGDPNSQNPQNNHSQHISKQCLLAKFLLSAEACVNILRCAPRNLICPTCLDRNSWLNFSANLTQEGCSNFNFIWSNDQIEAVTLHQKIGGSCSGISLGVQNLCCVARSFQFEPFAFVRPDDSDH